MKNIFRPDTYPLIALNVLDAASTHAAIKIGWAYEANPIMAAAWDHSPATFWFAKFFMLGFSLTLLSYTAKASLSRAAALSLCTVVYVAILMVHLNGWVGYFNTPSVMP